MIPPTVRIHAARLRQDTAQARPLAPVCPPPTPRSYGFAWHLRRLARSFDAFNKATGRGLQQAFRAFGTFEQGERLRNRWGREFPGHAQYLPRPAPLPWHVRLWRALCRK